MKVLLLCHLCNLQNVLLSRIDPGAKQHASLGHRAPLKICPGASMKGPASGLCNELQ